MNVAWSMTANGMLHVKALVQKAGHCMLLANRGAMHAIHQVIHKQEFIRMSPVTDKHDRPF